MRTESKTSKIDVSKGAVWKCIVAQAIPLTIAQLVQLFGVGVALGVAVDPVIAAAGENQGEFMDFAVPNRVADQAVAGLSVVVVIFNQLADHFFHVHTFEIG